MTVVSDLYVPGATWAHAVDPRVKLLFVACALGLLLVFENLPLMLIALVLVHALHASAGVPWARLRFVWRTLAPVVVLIFVLFTVFYPAGEPVLEVWVVEVTPHAMARGAALGLRIVTMAFVVFAWLYTTSQPALVRSLVKLGMPHEWGLVLALALRYIPTFQATFTMIVEAQQARGLALAGTGFARVRRMMPIFVAMIITSLRASEQLALAMEARALGVPGVRRTTLREIRLRPVDWALAGAILAATAAALWANLELGLGEDPIRMRG